MIHIAFLVAVVCGPTNPAQAWDIEWVDQFGNATSTSTSGIRADATGVYVSGSTFGALPGQVGAGGVDVYLRKYDFAGNALWTHQFGTPGTESGRDVATDPSGVYLAGRTTGTLPGQFSAGDSDAFVRKYNTNGDVLWTHQFGTSGFDAPWFNGIATHATGVYVAGETSGTFPGEPGGTGPDIFVAKLDSVQGEVLWARGFGNRGVPGTFGIGGVGVDDTGVYVAASLQRTVEGASTTVLRKHDFDGNLLWSQQYDMPSPHCGGIFWDVAVHAGTVYVVSQESESLFNPPAVSCAPGQSFNVVVGGLRAYDSDGNLLWTRNIRGGTRTGDEGFTGAKTVWASDAGVFVAANLTTTFPGASHTEPMSDRSECPGFPVSMAFFDKLDAYVRMYNFNGDVIWTRQFGSDRFDLVTGLGADASSVYAAGGSSCQLEEAETSTGGSRGAFVVRLAIEPTTASGQVQLIIGQIETLGDQGRLTAGAFNSLVQHLEAGLAAIERGEPTAAQQSLVAFVSQVEALRQGGALSNAEADLLVTAANAVIAQL